MDANSYKLVAIGASLGGLNAVQTILSDLPELFPLPVVITQHRATDGEERLKNVLQKHSAMPIVEVDDKMEITPSRVFLAPSDYHLLVEKKNFALSTDAPVSYARPSVDVLFETAAQAFGPQLIAVVLTGTGEDGAYGAASVEEHGGMVIIQNPNAARAGAMPQAAMKATRLARILPLSEISSFICALCATPAGRKV